MPNIEEIISNTLDECILDIRQRHVAAGQRATGRGMDSLERRVNPGDGTYVGEIWSLPYLGAWETGSRRARKSGSEIERKVFIAKLAEWCRIRGFPSANLTEQQYERTAKWLKWYIGKFGSKLFREGGRKDIITPAVEGFVDKLQERLSVYCTEKITSVFYNRKK